MRQRVTFIQKPADVVDPTELKVGDQSITGPDLVAVREERLTFALEELPPELSRVLKDTHELHVRWITPLSHDTIEPLNSRLPPGLHVFYTPLRDEPKELPELCADLREVFGDLDCLSSESFTKLPNDRFSHSAAFQYYQLLDITSPLIEYATAKLCKTADTHCATQVGRLSSATTIDISYDTISHALKATAWWPHQSQHLSLASTSSHRTEVGIFTTNSPATLEPHEVGITGFLAVLGEHKKPSRTIFAIPARHRDLNATFATEFLQPTGLHPTLQLTVSSSKPPTDDAFCAVHAYFTLPKHTFADRYQLEDGLFLASKNLTALRYMSAPVDLEAPAYTTAAWGSSVLLELAPPAPPLGDGPWTAELPLHFRYMEPNAAGFAAVELPYPAVFWACASEEGTKFPNSPFDRVNLGYDALFGPRTVFWHVRPRPVVEGRLTVAARIPVLETKHASVIVPGTMAAILVGFLWVVWSLVSAHFAAGKGAKSGKGSNKEESAEKKKKL